MVRQAHHERTTETLKNNYLAVRPEPFGIVHPELVEGMIGAQDRPVEG
jgi:hypothetical protein